MDREAANNQGGFPEAETDDTQAGKAGTATQELSPVSASAEVAAAAAEAVDVIDVAGSGERERERERRFRPGFIKRSFRLIGPRGLVLASLLTIALFLGSFGVTLFVGSQAYDSFEGERAGNLGDPNGGGGALGVDSGGEAWGLDSPDSDPAASSYSPVSSSSGGSSSSGSSGSADSSSSSGSSGSADSSSSSGSSSTSGFPGSGAQTGDPDQPLLAIVIDDWGYGWQAAQDFLAFDRPLTVAVLPYLPLSRAHANEAHARGHQVILHLPMEPLGEGWDLGQGAVTTAMTSDEIEVDVRAALEAVPHISGVNNHMGSKATVDPRVVGDVLAAVQSMGFFFLDSRTNAASVVPEVAQELGVPFLENDRFIDPDTDSERVKERILLAARLAKRRGYAIAIGHVRPETYQGLVESLPELEREGVRLAYLDEILERVYPDLGRRNLPSQGSNFRVQEITPQVSESIPQVYESNLRVHENNLQVHESNLQAQDSNLQVQDSDPVQVVLVEAPGDIVAGPADVPLDTGHDDAPALESGYPPEDSATDDVAHDPSADDSDRDAFDSAVDSVSSNFPDGSSDSPSDTASDGFHDATVHGWIVDLIETDY